MPRLVPRSGRLSEFDLSLVITTLGRREQLARCLASLAGQTRRFREVIVVDQNTPGFLDSLLEAWSGPVALRVVRSARGSTLGRNRGAEVAEGEYLGFPDDDCWYSPATVEQVATVVERSKDVAWWAGRIVDADGRPVILRWPAGAGPIRPGEVWRSVSLGSLFVRADAFRSVDGFDERLGVGSVTGLESSEEIDLVLRLGRAGWSGRFEPAITVHHAADRDRSDPEQASRARRYGRGMGFVLASHPLSWRTRLRFFVRPLGGAALGLLRGSWGEARYHLAALRGRLEGWRLGRRASAEVDLS